MGFCAVCPVGPVVGEALLLGFFELRGDLFNAEVVGVGLGCYAAIYDHAASVGTRRHIDLLFSPPKKPEVSL
jgi:hypothetical protein